MRRASRLLARLIGWLPSNAARVTGYRIMGHTFGAGCRIGLGTVIAVERFSCASNVVVGRGNVFQGPMTVILGEGTFIGRWNTISCGDVAGNSSKSHMDYARHFETGRDCLVHERHLFDVYGRITIGEGSWVAGFASQFLTHGASAMDRDIRIGRRCYLGSAVRFAPGSGIADDTIVAMGAVVTKSIAETGMIVGGVPAKVIKSRSDDSWHVFEKFW